MTDAEQLDRLLQMVVQEEIRRLMENAARTKLWDWQHQYMMYIKEHAIKINHHPSSRFVLHGNELV